MHWYFGDDQLVPPLVQHLRLAAVYRIGFAVVLDQFKPLPGESGS
jgi:hypothetical protein